MTDERRINGSEQEAPVVKAEQITKEDPQYGREEKDTSVTDFPDEDEGPTELED
jgi:hypothetical protein